MNDKSLFDMADDERNVYKELLKQDEVLKSFRTILDYLYDAYPITYTVEDSLTDAISSADAELRDTAIALHKYMHYRYSHLVREAKQKVACALANQ